MDLSTADQLAQVEYAVKAVENGGTAVGIRCKDGVVLAVEKIITSKLLKPGANKRIATVDRHVGIVSSCPESCLDSLHQISPFVLIHEACDLGIGWACTGRPSFCF